MFPKPGIGSRKPEILPLSGSWKMIDAALGTSVRVAGRGSKAVGSRPTAEWIGDVDGSLIACLSSPVTAELSITRRGFDRPSPVLLASCLGPGRRSVTTHWRGNSGRRVTGKIAVRTRQTSAAVASRDRNSMDGRGGSLHVRSGTFLSA